MRLHHPAASRDGAAMGWWEVRAAAGAPDLFPRAALPLQLDAVVVGQRLADDLLQVLDAPARPRPLPLDQAGLAAPNDLPPEQIHGPPPARVEERGRRIR